MGVLMASSPGVRQWTAEEEAIATDPALSDQEVAERIDRTVKAVQHRRQKLGGYKVPKVEERANTPSEPTRQPEPLKTPTPPKVAARVKKGGRGDVVALGNFAWMFLSLPVGIASPSGGAVMRLQIPNAGREIDTLLKGTAVYESLTSGGNAEKAMAAFNLGTPVLLSIFGDLMFRRLHYDESGQLVGNSRDVAMVNWLQQMTQQALAAQGINIPAPAAPIAVEVAPAPASSPEPEPSTNGQVADPAGVVAASAAEASRFDAVE